MLKINAREEMHLRGRRISRIFSSTCERNAKAAGKY
jgi:hypothetical protein